MNKEDILARSRHENKDEIYEYIDNKALTIASIIFVLISLLMFVFSFISTIQNEMIYTTLSLLWSYISIYCFARYYYLKSKVYMVTGTIVLCLAAYSVVQVWLIIW